MAKNDAAFRGRRLYWLRQLSDCEEPDFAGVCSTLLGYGGTGVGLSAKCMDGLSWQGAVDPKTPLLRVGDVQSVQQLCYQNGVSFAPVVVPRGTQGEAAAHGRLAAAVGCLVIDIEAGPGFWDGSPLSGIPEYFYELRLAAPDAYLVAQPDPRNLGDVRFPVCLPYLDGVAAQHYVGWTEVGWSDVVAEVARFDAIRALGLPCYPTLYGTGNPGQVATFWRAVRDYAAGLSLFAFGAIGPAQFAVCRQLKLPGEPVE